MADADDRRVGADVQGRQAQRGAVLFLENETRRGTLDLTSDRDEIHNLAAAPEHRAALEKLRAALRENEARILDVGLLPEGEMHRRSAGTTPYDFAHDAAKFDFAKLYATADLASSLTPDATPALIAALADADSGIRCWAALGLLMRGADAVKAARDALIKALDDPAPDVRVTAAEALGQYGGDAGRARALALLGAHADWSKNDVFTALTALDAITMLGEKAAPLAALLKTLPEKGPLPDARFSPYVPRLLEDLRATFK